MAEESFVEILANSLGISPEAAGETHKAFSRALEAAVLIGIPVKIGSLGRVLSAVRPPGSFEMMDFSSGQRLRDRGFLSVYFKMSKGQSRRLFEESPFRQFFEERQNEEASVGGRSPEGSGV